MREICHLQAGQCGNQIGAKVIILFGYDDYYKLYSAMYNISPHSLNYFFFYVC